MSRDNYNPYRIVGAKKIDVWFYEEGDMDSRDPFQNRS